jgi:SAM-dependent methyltransferase
MTATDSKQRFSDRVENYVRYRPGYPVAIVDLLREKCGLTTESVIADIGSGTGILAQLFLDNGNLVYGVEPNAPMRDAGEQLLEKYPHFCSVAGSAEATTLPNSTADFILAGQAFHWFDAKAALAEFERILKPKGWVAVIWNERKTDSSTFLRDYELFLRTYGTDYAKVSDTYPREQQMTEFFGAGRFHHAVFVNEQVFDFGGLRGRLLSSSYSPPPDHPQHQPMLAMLEKLFEAHAQGGTVRIEYQTHAYYGRLTS